MAGKINIYNFGGGGVNLVKNPLQLADDEVTQAQNAEFVPDEGKGGQGALSKRGGMTALNGSALAGSVLGVVGLPLNTTYTKSLLASLFEGQSATFLKTTNGTTWSEITGPSRAAGHGEYYENNVIADYSARNYASFKSQVLYPGDDYTVDINTAANGTRPPVVSWDGTTAVEVLRVPAGVGSDYASIAITDMIQANGVVYIATLDAEQSGAPNYRGRVLKLDLSTGTLSQVANAFGPGTGEVTGGFPCVLTWYQGQLFAGLFHFASGQTGKVVRCYPGTDTSWTTDTSTLVGEVISMAQFKGDLYVATHGSDGDARIYQRATSGAYTSRRNQAVSALGYYGNLIVFEDTLYATKFDDNVSDINEIIKSTDGTSWSVDRDVLTVDGSLREPTGAVVWEGALYIAYRAQIGGGGGSVTADGFILRKSGGSWSQVVSNARINGKFAALVERS